MLQTVALPCICTRKDGQPCTSTIVGPDGRCFMHSPDKQANLTAVRVAGGRAKSRAARLDKLVPSSLRPAIGVLFAALDEVHSGALTPAQGQAMAAIAGAIGRLYQTGVLEERLTALEQAYGGQGPGRRTAW